MLLMPLLIYPRNGLRTIFGTMVRYPPIIIGMITLGIVGYLSWAAIRAVGNLLMRWRAREFGLDDAGRRLRLLANLVPQHAPGAGRIRGRDAYRHCTWIAACTYPSDLSDRVSDVRNFAPHPSARLGAGLHVVLADAGAVDRVHHLSGRVLHDRDQCPRRTRDIDRRYLQSAYGMGSTRKNVFFRVLLPATLPSIAVGAAVGMGITWEVVVAAEMISGGGSSMGAAGMSGGVGGGLGFFIWNSYTGGSYEQIIVGMISIGIAGYISSSLIRLIGRVATPWLAVI